MAMRNGTVGMLTAVFLLGAFFAGVVRATIAWEASAWEQHETIRPQARELEALAA
jgi:hypothetical protein